MNPFVEAATILKTIFDEEFSSEGFVMIFDNLHPAMGRKRVDVGVAPTEERPMSRDYYAQETWMEVRFYDLWKEEIDPATLVNPTRITDFAYRFRDAIRRHTEPGTGNMWYFNVERTEYPDDPTGNKTRFHMTIVAYGNNNALVETTE